MKSRCIVFGAGGSFETYVAEIEDKYEILAVSDNNTQLHGTCIREYLIIPPEDIIKYQFDTVIICSNYAKEIQEQLLNMGIEAISYFIPPGIVFDTKMDEGSSEYQEYFHKKNNDRLHVLFVQITPCARTIRFAELLRKNGLDCSLAYFGIYKKADSRRYFENIIHFFAYEDLIDYVRNSEYDLIHCSNEPDILTCLLHETGKPIVHDCHDFMTLRDIPSAETIALELIANTRSDGYIYPSNQCLQIAMERYRIDSSKAIYIENYPSKDALPRKHMKKLSALDGEIHCVYEGSIAENPNSYRYFEDQWMQLSSLGIHVHFYTQYREDYCRYLDSLSDYIHYEGSAELGELLNLMTQYDIGLCTYVELIKDKVKLDTASPTKFYEYVAAGLPVALSNHLYHRNIYDIQNLGMVINWGDGIKMQFKRVAKMHVPEEYITVNHYTIEDEAKKLISFYKDVIDKKGK